jgi:hypothetical protein
MKIWKFFIPSSKFRPLAPEDQIEGQFMEVEGRLALVIANTQEEGQKHLEERAIEEGDDPRWIKVANVISIPIPMDHSVGWKCNTIKERKNDSTCPSLYANW